MQTSYFSPSVNIIRDQDIKFNYIPTPNSQFVYNHIVSNYIKGSRAFNIIGAYGTGKSSFIIALEQSLNQKANYFNKTKLFNGIKSFKFVNIVGEYKSFENSFNSYFDPNLSTNYELSPLDFLDNYYNSLKKKNKALVLVVDEFGKFLEYAAKNNPERELYFIQQLAEFVNDVTKEIFFITVLHQNFNAYSNTLSRSQQNEWNKVKGRLIELNFNEPVEQLLFLASKRLEQKKYNFNIPNSFNKLFLTIEAAKAFPFNDFFDIDFVKNLYPLDILSAATLTLSLQEYAQNERSLFTFIENDEHLGIAEFKSKSQTFYSLSNVYDYLIYYHFAFISTKYNPHYSQWSAIKEAIERAESILDKKIDEAISIIKTIGLLNIFGNKGIVIDKNFLASYAKYSLGIKDPLPILDELIKYKIIRYSNFDNKFKIFEGTDLDIELAIDEAGNLVERVKNVTDYLHKYFDFPVIPAKEVSYEYGTPRFFSFILSEEPVIKTPQAEIDGFVNLIFNEGLEESAIIETSKTCNEAIIYGLYKNISEIQDVIYEIEKVKKAIAKYEDDKVANRELKAILEHYKKLLNHYIINCLYNQNSKINWFYNGEKLIIDNQRSFNKILSKICKKVYFETPIFNNEMVNKTTISATISTARKKLIPKLLYDSDIKNLKFEEDKFPAEKTIYLSLIKETGIHTYLNDSFVLTEPSEESFKGMWNACIKFFESTKARKRNLTELINILKSKPYKLKQGFLDFWIPILLVIKKDDFALFGKTGYIPDLNEDILELINKTPKDFHIKAFDLSGKKLELFNKYREILNQVEQLKPTNQSFIETIKPFLTFYKSLPSYSTTTKNLSKNALQLREAIRNATDPENSFFDNFPEALGFNVDDLIKNKSSIEDFTIELKERIQEINAVYDKLLNHIEEFIDDDVLGENLSFPRNKILLQKRYKKLKKEVLNPYQKVFYQRINSMLDDRKTWINSLAQACIGKSLENFSDEEIEILKYKLSDIIHELDNLTDLSESDINTEKEEIIKLEITSFLKGLSKNYIRIPKNKYKKISNLEASIKKQIHGNDRTLNIALLTKLLQQEIDNE